MLMTYKSLDISKNSLYRVIRALNNLALVVIMVMVLLLVADVILRRIFNSPLPWGFEMIKVLLAVIVSVTIAFCAIQGGHISIDLLTSRLPLKVQKFIGIVMSLFGTALFAFMTWGLYNLGSHFMAANRTTGVLPVPIAYFVFLLAFGSLLVALVQMVNLIFVIVEATGRKKVNRESV